VLVFSVDEKSQIQALDRTQPGLPIKKGRAGTMTHEYKRRGTTTLFASLDVATGKVIDQCMKRYRHQEWLKFLRRIDAEAPPHLDIRLIADNYATHKHAKVKVGSNLPPETASAAASSKALPDSLARASQCRSKALRLDQVGNRDFSIRSLEGDMR
jgi:hypothetical protein